MTTNLILKIVVAVVILGGGFFVYQNSTDKEKKTEEVMEKITGNSDNNIVVEENSPVITTEEYERNTRNIDYEKNIRNIDTVQEVTEKVVDNNNNSIVVEKNSSVIIEKTKVSSDFDKESKSLTTKGGSDILPKEKGKYIKLSELNIEKENGIVVLNFYAPWCPSCRAIKKDIEAKLGDIPAGVTIVEVDYDTEKSLAKKYGVRYQHTFVQVDKDLNKILKWSGGITLESILNKIKK